MMVPKFCTVIYEYYYYHYPYFLAAYSFPIGRQSYQANYFATFQRKIWWTFFFVKVTFLKIERNEDAMCKVPLYSIHMSFGVK